VNERQILMLGTAPGARSGIATLVQAYAANGLFQRWNAIYLPTHRDGGRAGKLALALGAWLDVMSRLVAGRVALLHIHLASFASFWRKALFMLPAHLLRVPYVLHVHGGAFGDFYDAQSEPARAFIRQRLRGAARVIARSPAQRDALSAIEPAARIDVIPNPVEIPAWQAGLEASPPTVLFLGMLLERKGLKDLLHAWPAVIAAIPDARLVLAGAGDVAEAERLVDELRIEHSVRIAGWVESSAKEDLLRRAWVACLPSHVEALPMAVLEALAAGVPVVATRVGGIPFAVQHLRQGLLVAAGDVGELARSLALVLENAARRKAMGRAGRERAILEFSSEVIVPRLEAIWRDLAPRQEFRARAPAA
jgi:glycosyltransferase involved in cell wall biosynthesis